MDLTPEQLQEIVAAVQKKVITYFDTRFTEIDIPDTRNLATKKLVSDAIQELKTGFNNEIVKIQTAVTKVAEETDVKIKALTPPKEKPWYATLLD